jgi:hypothetical protein
MFFAAIKVHLSGFSPQHTPAEKSAILNHQDEIVLASSQHSKLKHGVSMGCV